MKCYCEESACHCDIYLYRETDCFFAIILNEKVYLEDKTLVTVKALMLDRRKFKKKISPGKSQFSGKKFCHFIPPL